MVMVLPRAAPAVCVTLPHEQTLPPCCACDPHLALPATCAQVVKHSRLLSSSSTAFLQQKLQLRAPYVAPLNILQARVCCAGYRPGALVCVHPVELA